MWLKKLGYEPNDFIEDMILNNTIDNLPQDVKLKFRISDCYVYLPLEESYINELKSDIISTVNEINKKAIEYKETENENLFWSDITNKNEYYFNVLSGYSRKLHKPYDEFLKEKEMFIQQDKEQRNHMLKGVRNMSTISRQPLLILKLRDAMILLGMYQLVSTLLSLGQLVLITQLVIH